MSSVEAQNQFACFSLHLSKFQETLLTRSWPLVSPASVSMALDALGYQEDKMQLLLGWKGRCAQGTGEPADSPAAGCAFSFYNTLLKTVLE